MRFRNNCETWADLSRGTARRAWECRFSSSVGKLGGVQACNLQLGIATKGCPLLNWKHYLTTRHDASLEYTIALVRP